MSINSRRKSTTAVGTGGPGVVKKLAAARKTLSAKKTVGKHNAARATKKATKSKTVSILIIDDDLERRRTHYENFFAILASSQDHMFQIHLVWSETPRDAYNRVIGGDADLILLDMMLTHVTWVDHSDSIYKAIKASHVPIVLLSEDFTSDPALKQIHKVFFDLRGTPILGFIPFSPWVREHSEKQTVSLPDTQVEVWTMAFHEALDSGRDHRWQPGNADEITFLHLTDTHFGKTDPDYLNADAIAKGAAKHRLSADFVLWTGDISNTGAPAEFSMAKRFLDDLIGAGLLARNAPIAMVPGNHDLSWPLALASRAEIRREEASSNNNWEWALGRKTISRDLWKFGFQPYSDFFEKVISAEEPQKSGAGFRWLDQWAHRGFAILELPIECHSIRSDSEHDRPEPLVTADEFHRVSENAFKTIQKSKLAPEVCIILLVHGRDPNVEPDLSRRWVDLRERLHEAGHVTIVFAGHEHEAQFVPQRRELTIVGVPHDPKLTGGTNLPGVYFITMRRLNSSIPECRVTKLERRQDEISRAIVWKAQATSCWGISSSAGHACNWIQTVERSR